MSEFNCASMLVRMKKQNVIALSILPGIFVFALALPASAKVSKPPVVSAAEWGSKPAPIPES
ncbi:MAG: hypothetical protein K2X81_12790, partial [Candidatus Obscuribacterales bacterium]|nr:hypothetical protein [Candidatus Obscuribacterales bacterium]